VLRESEPRTEALRSKRQPAGPRLLRSQSLAACAALILTSRDFQSSNTSPPAAVIRAPKTAVEVDRFKKLIEPSPLKIFVPPLWNA